MSLQAETFEALCSTFYRMPFSELLGEKDMPEGRTAWFHFGKAPKDIRVAVVAGTERETVLVRVEWRNYHTDPRHPLKGEQTFHVSTYAATQSDLADATQRLAVRVLEIFRDVESGSGVAGKIAALQEPEEKQDEEA